VRPTWFGAAGKGKSATGVVFDFTEIGIPSDAKWIHYNGSFTTPPCTADIPSFLLEQPILINTKLFDDLNVWVNTTTNTVGNYRPLQLFTPGTGEKLVYTLKKPIEAPGNLALVIGITLSVAVIFSLFLICLFAGLGIGYVIYVRKEKQGFARRTILSVPYSMKSESLDMPFLGNVAVPQQRGTGADNTRHDVEL